jgi:hypothetical protein
MQIHLPQKTNTTLMHGYINKGRIKKKKEIYIAVLYCRIMQVVELSTSPNRLGVQLTHKAIRVTIILS